MDLLVDVSLYPVEAVMGAAYVFVDRCYVFVDREADGKVKVSLTARPGREEPLEALRGEFQNELLAQALRRQVALRHAKEREALVVRALFGAAPQAEEAPAAVPALDAQYLPAEGDDYLEDPLGIAVPWEEKYGQAAAAPAGPGTPERP